MLEIIKQDGAEKTNNPIVDLHQYYRETQQRIMRTDLTGLAAVFEAWTRLPLVGLYHEEVEGPAVVVMGDESAGKSTILARIVNLDVFPRGKDLCTRLAILVRLRSGAAAAPVLRVLDGGRVLREDTFDTRDYEAQVRQRMNEVVRGEGEAVVGISPRNAWNCSSWGRTFRISTFSTCPDSCSTQTRGAPSMNQDTHDLLDDIIKENEDCGVFLAVGKSEIKMSRANWCRLSSATRAYQSVLWESSRNATTRAGEEFGSAWLTPGYASRMGTSPP